MTDQSLRIPPAAPPRRQPWTLVLGIATILGIVAVWSVAVALGWRPFSRQRRTALRRAGLHGSAHPTLIQRSGAGLWRLWTAILGGRDQGVERTPDAPSCRGLPQEACLK